jgi:hypothetical protein
MPAHAADGSINVTVVNGSTYVGRYAPNGSMNVVSRTEGTYTGIHHPSGAMNVVLSNSPSKKGRSPGGGPYVAVSPYTNGGDRVTVVSGAL